MKCSNTLEEVGLTRPIQSCLLGKGHEREKAYCPQNTETRYKLTQSQEDLLEEGSHPDQIATGS
jgi:hypothetical protein